MAESKPCSGPAGEATVEDSMTCDGCREKQAGSGAAGGAGREYRSQRALPGAPRAGVSAGVWECAGGARAGCKVEPLAELKKICVQACGWFRLASWAYVHACITIAISLGSKLRLYCKHTLLGSCHQASGLTRFLGAGVLTDRVV